MKKLFLILVAAILLNAGILEDIEQFNITLRKVKNGDNNAKYNLALAYFKGKGTQKDVKQGYYWLVDATKNGALDAMWLMSKIRISTASNKEGVQKGLNIFELIINYQKYFPEQYEKNKKKANKYKALTYIKLGTLYKKGSKFIQKDDEKAIYYYLEAFNIEEVSKINKDIQKSAIEYLNSKVATSKKLLRYTLENEDFSLVKNSLSNFKGINKFYTINKYLPKKARYRVDMTPLLMAIQNDDIVFAKELIRYGADINLANSRGETPILCAMRNENIEFVKELMKMGADTSVLDNEGNSIFSYAIKANKEDIAIKVLKNKNFNIHQLVDGEVFQEKFAVYPEYISKIKYKNKVFTYLHIAARYGANKVLKKLIKMGLDVNVKMKDKGLSLDTLGIAARFSSYNSVDLLLKYGANPYVVYTNPHPEGNYGLYYWGGLSAKYTLLSMVICSEHIDEKLLDNLLSLKNAKWYVENESEYFYYYLLQRQKASKNKKGVYKKVLDYFDTNNFKNMDEIRKKFEKLSSNLYYSTGVRLHK